MEANGEYLKLFANGKCNHSSVFGIKEDGIVEQKFKELFPDFKIATVNSNEIARDGGTNKYYPFVFTFGYSF
jgi:agmatine/peptidylarginine deiminase